MANIKISELNELYGHQRAYDDYIPVVDSSADETKKISVKGLIPNNVNIIAVTNTAPLEYETGDKYYNTTENKIYTALSTGWGNAETPIEGILYIILEEQKSYTYDGDNETLVSVGGGSGGETLPVGTVVEFDGTAQDIPDGWEQTTNKQVINLTSDTQSVTFNNLDFENYQYKVIITGKYTNVYPSNLYLGLDDSTGASIIVRHQANGTVSQSSTINAVTDALFASPVSGACIDGFGSAATTNSRFSFLVDVIYNDGKLFCINNFCILESGYQRSHITHSTVDINYTNPNKIKITAENLIPSGTKITLIRS